MKTCIKLIIIATVINLAIALAAASQVQSETPILCPTQIDCSRDKSISSCKATGGSLEYWGEVGGSSSSLIKKGTYLFNGAFAYYQSSEGYDYTRCDYVKIESDVNYTLQLLAKVGSDLEALPNAPTK